MTLRTACCLLMLIVGFCGTPNSDAADALLPPDIFTAIALKSQNYERNIGRIDKDKVSIGIVNEQADNQSVEYASAVQKNINQAQDVRVSEHPISSKIIPLSNEFKPQELKDSIIQGRIVVLIIISSHQNFIKKIISSLDHLSINTICNSRECALGGIGLSVILRDNKPRMLINLEPAKRAGSDYSAEFLALCEQVR